MIFDQELIQELRDTQGADKDSNLEFGTFKGEGQYVAFKDRPLDAHYLDREGPVREIRKMKGSNFMITYVLHHRMQDKEFNEYVMRKMSMAAQKLFNDPEQLQQILMIGRMIVKNTKGLETQPMEAKKADNIDNYPSSYPNDSFDSHIYYTEASGSIELAPRTGFYHFHVVLKIAHWTKLQVSGQRLVSWMKQTMLGRNPMLLKDEKHLYHIMDKDSTDFYKETDNPHIDIMLLPSEDWEQVVHRYVFKTVDYNNLANNTDPRNDYAQGHPFEMNQKFKGRNGKQ
jgi:hypothetical protein